MRKAPCATCGSKACKIDEGNLKPWSGISSPVLFCLSGRGLVKRMCLERLVWCSLMLWFGLVKASGQAWLATHSWRNSPSLLDLWCIPPISFSEYLPHTQQIPTHIVGKIAFEFAIWMAVVFEHFKTKLNNQELNVQNVESNGHIILVPTWCNSWSLLDLQLQRCSFRWAPPRCSDEVRRARQALSWRISRIPRILRIKSRIWRWNVQAASII